MCTIAFAAGCWTLATPTRRFTAPLLVNAAGAWADTVAALAGELLAAHDSAGLVDLPSARRGGLALADAYAVAQRLAELRPLEQRWLRRVIERKGAADTRLDEYRWLLEELRVSLFAQELRTPQPVSVKRLEKVWSQLSA